MGNGKGTAKELACKATSASAYAYLSLCLASPSSRL